MEQYLARYSPGFLLLLVLWHPARRTYRSRGWDRAAVAWHDLTHLSPRPLYSLYNERIVKYRKEAPAADWNGVTPFETK